MENCFCWKDSQVKKLFIIVEKYKSQNKSLMEAFKEFAKKYGRKPNSVRNYYYQEVANMKANTTRAKNLGIEISKHCVLTLEKFSNQETKNLVKEILKQKCLGVSTRKACLNLAQGDLSKMVRFQNKFRSVVKTNQKLYTNILQELKVEGLEAKNQTKSPNVVFLKKQPQKKLSEEDINSLFLGLIKLVKKTTEEDVALKFAKQAEIENNKASKTLSKFAMAQATIEKLEKNILKLNHELTLIKEENCQLKTKIAKFMSEKILKVNKNKSLLSYLKEMKQNGNDVKTVIK